MTFAYGAPGAAENAAARITQVVDEAGQETRGYGKLGELVRSTRTVVPLQPGDAARTYETRFTFDSFGRMLLIVYPDGETLHYGYDGGCLATSVVIETEDGKVLEQTEDPTNILHRLLPGPDDEEYANLGKMDWYGDTTL